MNARIALFVILSTTSLSTTTALADEVCLGSQGATHGPGVTHYPGRIIDGHLTTVFLLTTDRKTLWCIVKNGELTGDCTEMEVRLVENCAPSVAAYYIKQN